MSMSRLPHLLQEAIERETESADIKELSKAREELTSRYRQPAKQAYMTDDAQRQSYLLSRLPATYAALSSCMQAIRKVNEWDLKSILDLGAGPGTALWASCENFPSIEKATLLEKDSSLSNIGKRLSQQSDNNAIQNATWTHADLEEIKELPKHGFVVLSYAIGELQSEAILPLIEKSWNATNQLLLIVEPGTPVGFERIRLIRSHLISLGAHLVAPCPHALACPMAGGDWCHFAVRVERTSLHRKLKGGVLSYEDEKFSYVAVSRSPQPLPTSRILSEPQRHSGHVALKLCTKHEGLQNIILSKKRGDIYKQARKSEWGDAFH